MEDWFEFNDVNVKKLDPTDVQQCFDFAKRAEAGELPTSFDDTPLRPEARASKSKPLSAPEIKASSETEGVDASTSAPETKAAEAEGAEAPASVEEPETPVALSLPAFSKLSHMSPSLSSSNTSYQDTNTSFGTKKSIWQRSTTILKSSRKSIRGSLNCCRNLKRPLQKL